MNKTFQTTVLVALLLCSAVVSRSQVVSSTPASQVTTPEIAKVQEALDKVLNDAGVSFKEGLLLYSENNRSLAGGKFNKAVEVFLYSTLNIQKDQKLQGCYNQLVETIYRIEVPNESTPTRVQNLAKTCGWTIDDKLAKSIAKTGLGGRIGFTSQEFKPSPLDELSKLEITPDEQKVDNLVAQKQYISYAAANKSFRFSFKVNPTVQQFIDYYRDSGRKSMEVGLYRSGMFTRMARRIFTEEGVPENIT